METLRNKTSRNALIRTINMTPSGDKQISAFKICTTSGHRLMRNSKNSNEKNWNTMSLRTTKTGFAHMSRVSPITTMIRSHTSSWLVNHYSGCEDSWVACTGNIHFCHLESVYSKCKKTCNKCKYIWNRSKGTEVLPQRSKEHNERQGTPSRFVLILLT